MILERYCELVIFATLDMPDFERPKRLVENLCLSSSKKKGTSLTLGSGIK